MYAGREDVAGVHVASIVDEGGLRSLVGGVFQYGVYLR